MITPKLPHLTRHPHTPSLPPSLPVHLISYHDTGKRDREREGHAQSSRSHLSSSRPGINGTHTHARTHTRAHTHSHTHTHACTHARTHTHTHNRIIAAPDKTPLCTLISHSFVVCVCPSPVCGGESILVERSAGVMFSICSAQRCIQLCLQKTTGQIPSLHSVWYWTSYIAHVTRLNERLTYNKMFPHL